MWSWLGAPTHRCCGSLKAAPTTEPGGHSAPVKFLAFEADPFPVMVIPRAESGRHHGHATGRTDRRTVDSIQATSIPACKERVAVDTPAPERRADAGRRSLPLTLLAAGAYGQCSREIVVLPRGGNGRYWARTSDVRLVEATPSQLKLTPSGAYRREPQEAGSLFANPA